MITFAFMYFTGKNKNVYFTNISFTLNDIFPEKDNNIGIVLF